MVGETAMIFAKRSCFATEKQCSLTADEWLGGQGEAGFHRVSVRLRSAAAGVLPGSAINEGLTGFVLEQTFIISYTESMKWYASG